jgi:hypothetical protein
MTHRAIGALVAAPRRSALLLIATLPAVLPGLVFAQKATPLRIEVQNHSGRAVLEGTLSGRQQAEYVVDVRAHQHLTLDLMSTPPGAVVAMVRNPDRVELQLRKSGPRRWTATLAQDGDHDIWVRRVADAPGVSRYRLTVTIR